MPKTSPLIVIIRLTFKIKGPIRLTFLTFEHKPLPTRGKGLPRAGIFSQDRINQMAILESTKGHVPKNEGFCYRDMLFFLSKILIDTKIWSKLTKFLCRNRKVTRAPRLVNLSWFQLWLPVA